MKKQLFIWLGNTLDDPFRWLVWDPKKQLVVDAGSLADSDELAKVQTASKQCTSIALLRGEFCVFTSIRLPSRRKIALRTIPYQLEDSLCQPLDEIHIAVGNIDKNLVVPTVTISKITLSDWLVKLDNLGIRVDVFTPDFLALSVPEGYEAVILQDDERKLFRSQHDSVCLNQRNFEGWFGLVEFQGDIRYVGYAPLNYGSMVQEKISEDVLEWIAKSFRVRDCVNLLQGEYELRNLFKDWANKLKLPGYLALAVLFMQISLTHLENLNIDRQIDSYDDEIETVFRSTFPAVRRVVNPRSQMKAKLNELKHTNGAEFFDLVNIFSKALSASQGITLQKMRFQAAGNAVQVYVSAADFSALDRLNDELQKAGVSAKSGAYQRTNNHTVSGNFTLRNNND